MLARFSCYVCGKQSTQPSWRRVGFRFMSDFKLELNYSQPGDLDECETCGRWVCADHQVFISGYNAEYHSPSAKRGVACLSCAG